MANYIYQVLNESDNAIYIGKTQNLNQRIRSHIADKPWIEEATKVLYTECISQTDMDIYEIYYINKYNPRYNSQSSYNCEFSQKLIELNFTESDINLKKLKENSYNKERRQISYSYLLEHDVKYNKVNNE